MILSVIYLFYSSFQEGHIDLLSSDHSPTVPQLKLLEEGDFLKAWGGISSLQVSELPCSEFRLSLLVSMLQTFIAILNAIIGLKTNWGSIGRLVVRTSSDVVLWEETWTNPGTLVVTVEQETCNICRDRIKGHIILLSFFASHFQYTIAI